MNITISPNYTNSSPLCSYANAPCATVTICDANNKNCSTVDNILIDSGSYGFRVFASALQQNTLKALLPVTEGNQQLAECMTYGDLSQVWGPVYTANLQLSSNATAENVPIQILDSSFATLPDSCTNASVTPADFYSNGILGIGLYINDAGESNPIYYLCKDNSCNETFKVPVVNQVSNPIAFLPANNNGYTIQFDNIESVGSLTAKGTITFGVNTASDNIVKPSNIYPALNYTGYPTFNSIFESSSYYSLLDSGSSVLFLSEDMYTTAQIAVCNGDYQGLLCPISPTTIKINNINSFGTEVPTSITISNAVDLINSGNSAFNNLGGVLPNWGFSLMDYGMPFFYGKSVQIVFDGHSAEGIGNGPLWAW